MSEQSSYESYLEGEIRDIFHGVRTVWDLPPDDSFGALLIPRLPYRGPTPEASNSLDRLNDDYERINSLLGSLGLSSELEAAEA